MEKGELKLVAESIFDRYPRIDKVFVTSDGQGFFDEIHANNHATNNRGGKELKVEIFTREEETGKSVKNTKTLIAEINAADSMEEVEAILEAEREGENRKTVLDAAQKKLDKLNTGAE